MKRIFCLCFLSLFTSEKKKNENKPLFSLVNSPTLLNNFDLNNRNNADDLILLEKFRQSGDPAILGGLYSHYMPLVYGVSLKYLKNRDEAKDAVMDIFEKLLIEAAEKEVHNFRSWLYVLTKNFCLMKLRSAQTHDKTLRSLEKDQEIFMESDDLLHPIDRNDKEMDKALEECIKKLKKEQKQCIQLFYYEDKCYRDIAVNLKIEEKKVKSYIQNGKRNLKICLEEKNVRYT